MPRNFAEGELDKIHTLNQPDHRIVVCTSCRHKNTDCKPGQALIERLRIALAATDGLVSGDFEISGIACMAGCDRPCTIAYQASRKATYLFGDIDIDEDVDDLVAFAKQYFQLEDGWCNSTQRPGKLQHSTLARVPAVTIVDTAEPAVAT